MQVSILADSLLLRLTPASILGLPQALEFLSDLVDPWECRALRSELHLRPLQDEHVAVVEVVGVSLRFILVQWLQLWWHRFPLVDSESLLGYHVEDQCQPLQAWPHILWELPVQHRACTSIGWIYPLTLLWRYFNLLGGAAC